MYDYIIVGAGTAGCVLANRLSQDPTNQVLLIESGPKEQNPLIQIPAAFSKLFKTQVDWSYFSTPQASANNRRFFLPRGKVTGGSSSINAMIYIRGHQLDYDHWAALGNKGWSYEDVLPYFIKSEHNERGGDAYHGEGGPLNVANLREPFPLSEAFAQAGAQLGYDLNPDFNGENQEGFGLYQVNQVNGKRCSAYRAFIKPVLHRPNLKVLAKTPVIGLNLEGKQVVGVECKLTTHIQEFKASKEIILSAGAYNSPHLLMLSGIGPGAHLQSSGITVKHDLPGVGQNLQDHVVVPMTFHTQLKQTLDRADLAPSNFLRFMVWGDGPLSSNVAEAGGFIRTRPELPAPDIQYVFAPASFKNHGFETLPIGGGRGFSIGPTLLTPQSIGEVLLQSPDPMQLPLIDHNYLSHEEDMQSLVAGMQIAYRLIQAPSMASYVKSHISPSKTIEDPADLAEYIRNESQTLYHPAGTCKMGHDEMAVVDDELKVIGLTGLRVVDASIMPTVIRGNTNAPTYMIAEKAADMILGQTTVGTAKALISTEA